MSEQDDKPADSRSRQHGAGQETDPPALIEPELTDVEAEAPVPDVELGTKIDDIVLTEPTLGDAEISEVTAEQASLREAAAEAHVVEQQAEEAGTLVAGPLDPRVAAAAKSAAPAADDIGVPEQTGSDDENGDGDQTNEDQTGRDDATRPDGVGAPHSRGAVNGSPLSDPGRDSHFQSGAQSGPVTGSASGQNSEISPGPAPHDDSADEPRPPDDNGSPAGSDHEDNRATDNAAVQDAEGSALGAVPPWTPVAPPQPPVVLFPSSKGHTPVEPSPAGSAPAGSAPAGSSPAGPGVPTQPGAIRPDAELKRDRGRRRFRRGPPIVVVLCVVVVLVIIVIILAGTGVIGAKSGDMVPPVDSKSADCLTNFDTANKPADPVPCTTAHEAQLVATYSFRPRASYPGEKSLKAKAASTCDQMQISAAAQKYTLKKQFAYPTKASWANGDRRVDCFYLAASGTGITESLLP